MQQRSTYVPLEVAEQFKDFIVCREEQVLDAVKAKTREFNTLSLLKLIYQLKDEPRTFSELYVKSRIRMKRSFLNYLDLCVNYSFIKKRSEGARTIYSITDKGQTMLNLFLNKNC